MQALGAITTGRASMRCSDLEKVVVDARGSDRRAGAGPLHGIRKYVRNTSSTREVSE